VIPRQFEYHLATGVDDALTTLSQAADAKILAGGHSLLPMMKLRLADPQLLVDIGHIDELCGVRESPDSLTMGAMTRQAQLVKSPLVRRYCPILSELTETVGDRQVRHRGTLGGALSHGDPAGDQPTLAVALDAQLVIRGPRGQRTVPAREFFLGPYQTALARDELLVEIRLPKFGSDWGCSYQKFSRVEAGWAIVGVLAGVRLRRGVITEARIGLTHMSSVPVRAGVVEQRLTGAAPGDRVIEDAAAAADSHTYPPSELHASKRYRRHLARVLTRRALASAIDQQRRHAERAH
jgi:carbon-monoxide dehydrogenase medium subunit